MKPFKATYQKVTYDCKPYGKPETVLIITIVPAHSDCFEAEAVFIRADGSLCQDTISRFTNCILPWPEN